MSEQLLTILKFILLAVIYLFFFRVLRAVWAEITPSKSAPLAPAKQPRQAKGAKASRARGGVAAQPGVVAPGGAGAPPPRAAAATGSLVVIEPPEQRGRRYSLASELNIGRAAGCEVTIDDTFVSQVHARVFARSGNYLVEDLGSTNGTYLNRKKVAGPMTMQRGDRLQVGNTVLELE